MNSKGNNGIIQSMRDKQYIFLVWQFISVFLFYGILGTAWTANYSKGEIFLTAIITVPVMLVLHELVHFLAIRLFTDEKVSWGFLRKGFWIRGMYVHTNARLSSHQWMVVKLAPLMLLTLMLTVIMLLTSHCIAITFFLSLLNFIGSYYDILDSIELYKKRNR